tara:strand:- start:689 stop:1498 length:810 start_codon:yes stop_codon:yes gene_type:complete
MSFPVRYVKRQLGNKRCVNFNFVGETGSGKSYSALRFAEEIDPTFSIDRCLFDVSILLDKINEKDEKGKYVLKKGCVIMLDEGGISASFQMHYMAAMAKVIVEQMETWRHRQFVFMITVPNQGLIQKKIRPFFDVLIETRKKNGSYINIKKGLAYVKWLFIQENQISNKVYYKNPRRKGRIIQFSVRKPSTKLIRAYEKKKKQFREELTIKHKQMIEELNKPDKKNEIDEVGRCKVCNNLGVYSRTKEIWQCRKCPNTWENTRAKLVSV